MHTTLYHFRLATRPWPSAGGHHEY